MPRLRGQALLPDIYDATQGRWRGILSQFGLDQRQLSGKQCPCPICGGKDRFRMDNKGGRGTWYCNQCGAGTGFDMVMKLRGWDFRMALAEIRKLVGIASQEPIKAGISENDARQMRRDLWRSSVAIKPGDAVDQYLKGRYVDQPTYPGALRLCYDCRYDNENSFTAMIAAVQDLDGTCVSLHRTWVKDGYKAPVDTPRKVMPGTIPNGSAVRLGVAGETLGIAEGIETALAASDLFSLPVWAALNATMLREWEPPRGVQEVAIFGDNDASFTGHRAVYTLANRLWVKKIRVTIHIPKEVGQDWNDVVIEKREGKS